jgi:cytochrome c biogenesis protein CcmG/thiol:disulfide interchange protein DsbE
LKPYRQRVLSTDRPTGAVQRPGFNLSRSSKVRALLLAALLVTLVACGDNNADTGSSSDTLAGDFSRLDGTEGSFADYRGTPVVVNFFASTCTSCVTEMPAFEQVNQESGGKVRFVGIDVGESAETTRSFIESVQVGWDIGLDPDGAIISGLGSVQIPTTVILDDQGTIVVVHSGPFDAGALRTQLQAHGLVA